MNGLHFTTRHQPVAARPECWSSIVRPYFGDLDVEPLGDLPLDAVLDVYTVGPLRLYRLQAPPPRVPHVEIPRELPFDGSYKLILLLQGRTEIRMCDRAFVLRGGDWSLYDPHVPYAITNHEQTSKLDRKRVV